MSHLLVVDAPVLTAGVVVAQNPEPPPGQGPEFGKASPVALVVILLLAVVTVLLIRSMNARVRRLPATFDPPSPTEGDAGRPDGDADGAEPTSGAGAGADVETAGVDRAPEPPARER